MRRIPLLFPALLFACGSTPKSMENGGDPSPSAASPSSKAPAASRPRDGTYGLPGFAVYADDGRLWVFREGSDDLASFLEKGEPAKRVSLIGAGPEGKTLYGADTDVMRNYADSWTYRRDGFVVLGTEGRLWVFRAGSEAYDSFVEHGEPAKRVTRVAAGPDGKTVLGAEEETLDAYVKSFPRP